MATPIVMPRLGDFMTEGTITKWAKPSGATVKQGEPIAEIESEKLSYDLEAAEDGILHIVTTEGGKAGVDEVVGYLLAEGEKPPGALHEAYEAAGASPLAPDAAMTTPPPSGEAEESTILSTPGARKLAAKLGVSIAQVAATGPRGRVTEADVQAHVDRAAQAKAAAPPAPAAPAAPATGGRLPAGLPAPSKVVPIQGMRKGIADRMRSSLSTTAQLSFFLEVDVTEAQKMRREFSQTAGKTVTLAQVLMKACAETLPKAPELNTVIADGQIAYFDAVNIGIAVALENGLIVPVLRNVEKKAILQIADEAEKLVTRAKEGKLTPDDVKGGTFTISVLGIVDGFTPVLNAGQSAILGVGRSVGKPAVHKGEVVVREMMTLSLTVDHQVVDGAVAATFMRRLQQAIERPSTLFR
ncbi:MAG: 2-oxo acid dehydrogenase subunit E2 [SAR202 cluster bacterium]|nr:2-oxo acid dehydrogenase subunit E2 [SAR202 cluster bacterium]